MTDDRISDTRRLRLREHQLFLALSIIIGILAGLAAVLFTLAIDRVDDALFGLAPSPLRTFLVPVLVSVGTGVLLATVFPGVRGSGVPQTKAAFHLHGGVIPARVPLGKFLTGVLCIGSGHSMGREGPSVQIGAGIASVAGRWLRLPPNRVKELIPVGAAGALAAAFNTPIAAVLFALEEIIGDLNATLLGSTVVASVASVVVERSIIEFGDTEICKTHPGFDEDLYITAEAEAFVKWHAGQSTWAQATRDGRIQLDGSPPLVRAFPTSERTHAA